MTKKEKQVQEILEKFKNGIKEDKNFPKDTKTIQVGRLRILISSTDAGKELIKELKKLNVNREWLFQHNFIIAGMVLEI